MTPNAIEYRRDDGTTFIVARTSSGRKFVIIEGEPGSYRRKPGTYPTRREAIAAGKIENTP